MMGAKMVLIVDNIDEEEQDVIMLLNINIRKDDGFAYKLHIPTIIIPKIQGSFLFISGINLSNIYKTNN